MSVSPHLFVFWPTENRYSSVGRTSIVNGSLRNESEEHLKEIPEIELSFNRKVYKGRIVYGGPPLKDVNAYLDTLTNELIGSHEEEPLSNPTKKRKKKSEIVGSDMDVVIEQVDKRKTIHQSTNATLDQEEMHSDENNHTLEKRLEKAERKLVKARRKIDDLKDEINKEKSLREKYQNKSKGLHKKLLKFQEDEMTSVDIGNGVKLNAALLDRAKIFSSSPAVLGRNIFRLVFEESEVTGKSLFGRVCNANKKIPAKPSVDERKRDAVISYCISVVEQDCKKSGLRFDKLAVRSKISKSLGEYIREVSRKSKQETHVVSEDEM